MTTMMGAVFEGNGVLTLKEVPVPQIKQPDDVCGAVRRHACHQHRCLVWGQKLNDVRCSIELRLIQDFDRALCRQMVKYDSGFTAWQRAEKFDVVGYVMQRQIIRQDSRIDRSVGIVFHSSPGSAACRQVQPR
jgi:hypothetical protein